MLEISLAFAAHAYNAQTCFLRQNARGAPVPVSKLRLDRPIAGSLRARASYPAKVRAALSEFGINPDYGLQRQLSLQAEAAELVLVERDVFKREVWLAPKAAIAWRRMRKAAQNDTVQLLTVSAFRSLEYQKAIIGNKLRRGLALSEILNVSAAPGYSEHHTGRALDLAETTRLVLEEDFSDTQAFAWLTQNAARFGFYMSFPRDNPHGVAFEPWHWCFKS